MINIPWEDLLFSDQTVDEKLELFTELIHCGLDTIMPERSLKVCVNDRPWMTCQLKRLIIQRQKAFTSDNKCLFKLLRNKVNRNRKRCRKSYYWNKVSALKGTKPYKWWSEIKQLCGASENNRPDFRSNLSINLNCGDYDLANKIDEAFIGVMSDFEPLTEEVCVMENAEDEPIQVTCDIVVKKLRQLSTTKANGPDNLPILPHGGWLGLVFRNPVVLWRNSRHLWRGTPFYKI